MNDWTILANVIKYVTHSYVFGNPYLAKNITQSGDLCFLTEIFYRCYTNILETEPTYICVH